MTKVFIEQPLASPGSAKKKVGQNIFYPTLIVWILGILICTKPDVVFQSEILFLTCLHFYVQIKETYNAISRQNNHSCTALGHPYSRFVWNLPYWFKIYCNFSRSVIFCLFVVLPQEGSAKTKLPFLVSSLKTFVSNIFHRASQE